MERTTITKNIKMYVLRCATIGLQQECGHKTSRRADMNLRFKPTAKIGQFLYIRRRKWDCVLMLFMYLTPFMFIICSVAYRNENLHPYKEGYTNINGVIGIILLATSPTVQVEASPIFSRRVRVNQWSDFFSGEVRFFPDIDRGTSGDDFVNYAEPTTQVFRCF